MRKFLKIQSELSVQSTNKIFFLIDNHYKTIFKSVRNARTSYRVGMSDVSGYICSTGGQCEPMLSIACIYEIANIKSVKRKKRYSNI